MNPIRVMMVGALALLASLAVACGDDDSSSSGGEAVTNGGGAGMIRPNTFMTFDGKRYELVNMIFEDMVAESEFQEAGVATEADIELKDKRVFSRTGDSSSVYTFSAATAEDVGFWLAWRATE